jgi:hypothetical protein
MIEHRSNSEWTVAGWLAIIITIMVALAALTPYIVTIPQSNITLITQAQTTLWNGWLVVLSYYFGTTQSQGRKDAAIQTLASTAQAAQAALTPTPNADVKLDPGQSATVTATTEESKS